MRTLFLILSLGFTGLATPATLAAEAPSEVVLFATGEVAVRRVQPKPRGTIKIQFPLPRALDGTVWIESDAPVREARAYWGAFEELVETRGRLDLLRQGIGGAIRLQLDEDSGGSVFEGTLVRLLGDRRERGTIPADDPNVQLMVQSKSGNRVLSLGSIAWFELPPEVSGTNPYLAPTERAVLDLRLAASRRDGETALTYISRGLSWHPSWALHLGEEGSLKARLDGKAVLINDLEPLVDTQVRLVVGHAPLNTGAAITALWPGARPVVPAPARSYARTNEMNTMAAPLLDKRSTGALPAAPISEQDLHLYDLGTRTLGVGERLYVPLLTDNIALQHRFVWTLLPHVTPQGVYRLPTPDRTPGVVHTLELKNDGDSPWTSGTLMVYGASAPLSRTQLTYTAAGDTATVRIAEARDLRRKMTERRQTSKGVKPETITRFRKIYERIRIEGTLEMENFAKAARPIRIERMLRGEVIHADDDPAVATLPPTPNDINPTRTLTWEFDLSPGELRSISYVYEVLIQR